MIRMLLAFAYQAGPVDDFVRFIERNPWRAITILNLIFLVGLAWTVYVTAGTRLGVPYAADVTGTEKTIMIAPASGIEGFDTTLFCNDKLTKVKAIPAPDASGITYELTRVRDQKTETVVVVLAPDQSILLAKHYYDAAVGQQSEPAIVGEDARKCIEKKR